MQQVAPGSWDRRAIQELQAVVDQFAHTPAKLAEQLLLLIRKDPKFLPARRLYARTLRHLGDHRAASSAELEAIREGILRDSFIKAEKDFLAGDLESAEVLIRQHLRHDPEDPAAALMLGEIANRCGARQEAENLFKRAIALTPSYTEARLTLAKMLRDHGRYDDALSVVRSLLEIDPAHLTALSLRAALLEQLRRFDEADKAFNDLHQFHPGDARGWANHAFVLKTIGRQEDAIAAYRQSLKIEPVNGLAWWGLSNLKTLKFSAEDVVAIRQALSSDNLSSDDAIHLNFALGKALDDLKDYPGAFDAYSAGAKARLEQVPYDPSKVEAHIGKSTSICTERFFEERKAWGSPAPDPIFVVSLPRSGSTLVEQILASHPMIEGTEELFDIERIALALDPDGETGGWLNVLPGLTREKVRELGDHYIEATRRVRHTDRPLFTDKMPSNWVFAGLIATILPNAKIVDVRRHPLGCGFANFSQHFNWGINFSYNLEHIGHFYRQYVRQMAHFDRVLPGRIHRITYEGLVENTETEVRRLLDYVGLPFDEACLRFFENKRAVFTPSSEQVRSPINREGMERWKSYGQFLDPLRDALGNVLTQYPEVPGDLQA